MIIIPKYNKRYNDQKNFADESISFALGHSAANNIVVFICYKGGIILQQPSTLHPL